MSNRHECQASIDREIAAHKAADQINAVFIAVQGVLVKASCDRMMADGYTVDQINAYLAAVIPPMFAEWRKQLDCIARELSEPNGPSHALQ